MAMTDRLQRACSLAIALSITIAASAHAGNPTRIQLVATIPNVALSITDASGEISGQVDGIATDSLPGANPGEIILGAQLQLSIPTIEGSPTFGHMDGGGNFVPGLPVSGADGYYSDPVSAANGEKLYAPPIEFDITGPNVAAQRTISLAVRIDPPSGTAFVVSKSIVIVKAPLVLVHGISQNSAAWAGFEPEFRNNLGFKTFAADHSGGAYTSGAPWWGGNADIHDCYTAVRGGLPGQIGVAEALDRFRTGHTTAHSGLVIAVKKVDIIASSYGGLCSRWYVEKAPDYGNDVRKLITMGTPHRGVPAANMNAQAAVDPVIANASSQLFSPVDTVAGTLELIDSFGFLRWKKDYAGGNEIVPSLQVMAFGSEVLGQLNDSTAFNDNVAYASIVGTDSELDFVVFTINVHYDLDPVVSILTQQKSYFPMMPILDAGANASDAVVPGWSARLPTRSTDVGLDHLSFHDSPLVHGILSIWLQDSTLPLGAEHRSAFFAQAIDQNTSRENAYRGSTLLGTESVNGGLVDDAIVQVKFSGPTLGEAGGLPLLDASGGIVTATMTGMVRVDVAGTPQAETITLVTDGLFFDTPLDAVTETLDPGTTPAGEFFTFSIDARFGRGPSSVVGPDGSAGGTGVWGLGYDINAAPDYTQAPWTDIDVPSFSLPSPFVPGETAPFQVGPAPGSPFTLEGGVIATAAGISSGTQSVTSDLLEDNFFTDTLLEQRSFNVSMPAGAFAGALVPYSEPGFFLFKNGSGHIEGSAGSSGETTATVYQRLTQPGASNPSSANVTVGGAP